MSPSQDASHCPRSWYRRPIGFNKSWVFPMQSHSVGEGGFTATLCLQQRLLKFGPSYLIVCGAQGESYSSILADLTLPPRQDDHICLRMRANSIDGLLLLRLPTRAQLVKGPPRLLVFCMCPYVYQIFISSTWLSHRIMLVASWSDHSYDQCYICCCPRSSEGILVIGTSVGLIPDIMHKMPKHRSYVISSLGLIVQCVMLW